MRYALAMPCGVLPWSRLVRTACQGLFCNSVYFACMYNVWFDGVAFLSFDAMPHSYVAFAQLLPALP